MIEKINKKSKIFFEIKRSVKVLDGLIDKYPDADECYKFLSNGGFSSISFILYISRHEIIKELTVATFRVGEKEFYELSKLKAAGRLIDATFFTSGTMKRCNEIKKLSNKYRYYAKFNNICKKNDWVLIAISNHSKVILIRTDKNYHVIETSSNLNENPQIEQFSWEIDNSLYNFYYDFFSKIKNESV